MPRYEIPGDPIRVVYGLDDLTGVFLSVYDKRLEYDPSESRRVNAVTEAFGVQDGGGSYFDLHTGRAGVGIRVDDETMATYLRRYGVPEDKIVALLPRLVSQRRAQGQPAVQLKAIQIMHREMSAPTANCPLETRVPTVRKVIGPSTKYFAR